MPRPDYEDLRLTVDGGVASIVLARSDGRNAMSTHFYAEIRDAFREADADPAVHSVIVSSDTSVFAVGGDLKEMASYLGGDEPEWDVWKFRDTLPFESIRSCRKPTIAVVDGTCVGGGFATAISCDFIIASPAARFGTPETKVGLIDGLVPSVLFGQIPLQALKYLLFSGNFFDAEQALRLGLIFDCVPSEELMPRALALAAEFEPNGLKIIGEYKRIFRSYERPVLYDDTIANLFRDGPTQRRVQGFFTRHKPARTESDEATSG